MERRAEGEGAAWGGKAWRFLAEVRERSTLIQCITNFVSIDLMANTLLAAVVSPAMLHSLQEIPDFTPHAHALCVNVGTLSPTWIPSMKTGASLATQLGKPWVVDPAAFSASDLLLKACVELVELKPTVIRGNASEILALSNSSMGPGIINYFYSQGVDSSHRSLHAVEAAKSLAQASSSIVEYLEL